MRKLIVFLLFACCATFGQQTNSDIIPATSGLNLGHSNQRWNGYFQNLDINGTCTVNGSPCLGAGSGGNGIVITNAAGLATVPGKQNGTIAVITDGLTANDCTVGGGITNVACQFNGTTWSQLPASSSANFASPPPLGNTTPNSVAGTVVNIVGSGLFFSAQPTCLFGESDNTLDEFEDVGGIPMWLPQGALGPCSQFLTYTPLPVGVSPTDKQVVAYNLPTNSWTVQSQAGGLADPGSNGVIKRTALNTTAVSTSADIIALFAGCSGTQYLGADGACHAAAGPFSSITGGTNTAAAMLVGSGASLGPTGTGTIIATSVQSAINTQTVNYQLALTDSGGLVRMNLAGANTLTVPADGTTNFPVGSAVTVRQIGLGQTTIVAAGGVTISTPSSLVVRVQNASVQVIKVAANTWDLIGDTQ